MVGSGGLTCAQMEHDPVVFRDSQLQGGGSHLSCVILLCLPPSPTAGLGFLGLGDGHGPTALGRGLFPDVLPGWRPGWPSAGHGLQDPSGHRGTSVGVSQPEHPTTAGSWKDSLP